MKTKILFFATVIMMAMSFGAYAQAPEKFNYQGIARDNTGAALANQALGIKISILHNSTVDYSETHTATTNDFGLYTLVIGEGTPVFGGMASVDWNSGNKFIKVEIDPNGGTSYTDLGTTELLSVPYALYAMESGSGSSGGSPTGPAGGDLSGSYPNPNIANNAVTSGKIANGAVATADLANNAVTSGKIDNGTIATADLANNAVTGAKIDAMGATTGQVLEYDGTNWAPATISTGGAALWTQNATDISYSGGNVGIGTTTPSEDLEVNGNIKLSDDLMFTGGPTITASGSSAFVLDGSIWAELGTSIDLGDFFEPLDELFINEINLFGQINDETGSAGTTGQVLTATATGTEWQTNPSAPWTLSSGEVYYDSGNVGIGTINPSANLHVSGAASGRFVHLDPTSISSNNDMLAMDAPSGATGFQFIEASNNGGNVFVVQDDGSVESGGNVSALFFESTPSATTTPGLVLNEFGSSNKWELTYASTDNLWFEHNGTLSSWISPSGTYNTSDKRLKENIAPIGPVMDKVQKIKIMNYTMKADENHSPTIGYIAQDLMKQFPEMVKHAGENREGTNYLGVNYGGMSAVAIKAIQEQQKTIESLQNTIIKMQARLDALEKQQ